MINNIIYKIKWNKEWKKNDPYRRREGIRVYDRATFTLGRWLFLIIIIISLLIDYCNHVINTHTHTHLLAYVLLRIFFLTFISLYCYTYAHVDPVLAYIILYTSITYNTEILPLRDYIIIVVVIYPGIWYKIRDTEIDLYRVLFYFFRFDRIYIYIYTEPPASSSCRCGLFVSINKLRASRFEATDATQIMRWSSFTK